MANEIVGSAYQAAMMCESGGYGVEAAIQAGCRVCLTEGIGDPSVSKEIVVDDSLVGGRLGTKGAIVTGETRTNDTLPVFPLYNAVAGLEHFFDLDVARTTLDGDTTKHEFALSDDSADIHSYTVVRWAGSRLLKILTGQTFSKADLTVAANKRAELVLAGPSKRLYLGELRPGETVRNTFARLNTTDPPTWRGTFTDGGGIIIEPHLQVWIAPRVEIGGSPLVIGNLFYHTGLKFSVDKKYKADHELGGGGYQSKPHFDTRREISLEMTGNFRPTNAIGYDEYQAAFQLGNYYMARLIFTGQVTGDDVYTMLWVIDIPKLRLVDTNAPGKVGTIIQTLKLSAECIDTDNGENETAGMTSTEYPSLSHAQCQNQLIGYCVNTYNGDMITTP